MNKMELVRQTETAECGLACLVMISRFHGVKIDIHTLRERFPVSLSGTNLRDTIKIADKINLAARPLKLELDNLANLKLPCILHWNFNHFVVLNSVKNKKVQIFDPGVGVRTYSIETVSKHFTGIALELQPTAEFKPMRAEDPTRINDLWGKLVGWQKAAAQTFILSLILQLTSLMLPLYLQIAIDNYTGSTSLNILTYATIGFAGIYLLNTISRAIRDWVVLNLGQSVSLQMIGNVFHHLLRLPPEYFLKRDIGDITSRVQSTQPIQEAMTRSVVAAVIDGLMFVFTLALMFLYSWYLTLFVLLIFLIHVGVTLVYFPQLRALEENEVVARASEESHLIESIRSSSAIKLFGHESEREVLWRNKIVEVINAGVRLGKLEIKIEFFQRTLFAAQIILIVYLGMLMVSNGGAFTIGMLFAFLTYRQQFEERATLLTQRLIEFGLLKVHLDRLSDIVKSQKEVVDTSTTSWRSNIDGKIDLRDIVYRYSFNEPNVLDYVDIEISAGEFIAIVGPSGGGKTTLLKVMQTLIAPQEGEMLIDDTDVNEFGISSWRSCIGVVQQEDRLFSGTIADNIAFFDPDIDMERVKQCAKDALIHNHIESMPMGYLSLAGDMGVALSGGQKQRILLARALYKSPSVLFLDEGTANLDIKTEVEIGEFISRMPITRIVVAHRPELVRRADRVFEVDNGQLYEIDKAEALRLHRIEHHENVA